jgi:hypothetical protein
MGIQEVSVVGSWQNNGKKEIRLCKGDCYKSVARKGLVESEID